MKYKHRILIGVCGAIGKMGPESQIIANKIGFITGEQIGEELLKRGILDKDKSYKEIWDSLNKAIAIDPVSSFEENDKEVVITIEDCQICPKKVGKYVIPATACPVGGIFRGCCSVVGKVPLTEPMLIPGKICKIVITK